MPSRAIEQILKQLDSRDVEQAWSDFLGEYSSPIYQVICLFESDADKAADCFQFVCEQLIKNNFRRLRAFKIDGAATFSTWLRAVTRNLCIDWHRKETGRPRPFKSITKLSAFDQEVFRLLYEKGESAEDVLRQLAAAYPYATEGTLAESRRRIEQELTPQKRWLLNTRFARSSETDWTTGLSEIGLNVADPNTNPEAQAIIKEQYSDLMRRMKRLSAEERLLIRLRFEQELTLDQIAKVLNLGNAQRVDRQLKQIITRLREESC